MVAFSLAVYNRWPGRIGRVDPEPVMKPNVLFDVLTADVKYLQKRLKNGSLYPIV